MNEPLILTPADKVAGAWPKLMAYWRERLEVLRTQLENPACTDIETARLRGQIKEIRANLAQDSVPAALEIQHGIQ